MRLLVIILLFIPFLFYGQNKKSFVINGVIHDLDGIAIPSVKVVFDDHFTFTNEQGEYYIEAYNKDPLILTFKHVGFLTKNITVKDRWIKNIIENDTLEFKKTFCSKAFT